MVITFRSGKRVFVCTFEILYTNKYLWFSTVFLITRVCCLGVLLRIYYGDNTIVLVSQSYRIPIGVVCIHFVFPCVLHSLYLPFFLLIILCWMQFFYIGFVFQPSWDASLLAYSFATHKSSTKHIYTYISTPRFYVGDTSFTIEY